jgi:Cu(I)/Ag(I) efflux system membrane protein CusA/SilA
MLTTGVRTPVGLKISASDVATIDRVGAEVEMLLPRVPGTRSVFAERTSGGYFLDLDWKRDALARYGLTIEDAQTVVMNAIGGETVTTTVEGRERYPVMCIFPHFRGDVNALGRALVPAMNGAAQVPLAQLADVRKVAGPGMIRNENGLLTGYVYVDVAGRDVGSYIDEAKRLIREHLKLPPGASIAWSGQYEAMERVRARMLVIVPLTLFLIFLLLYLNTRSVTKTLIIVLAVPFSAVGAICPMSSATT